MENKQSIKQRERRTIERSLSKKLNTVSKFAYQQLQDNRDSVDLSNLPKLSRRERRYRYFNERVIAR